VGNDLTLDVAHKSSSRWTPIARLSRSYTSISQPCGARPAKIHILDLPSELLGRTLERMDFVDRFVSSVLASMITLDAPDHHNYKELCTDAVLCLIWVEGRSWLPPGSNICAVADCSLHQTDYSLGEYICQHQVPQVAA